MIQSSQPGRACALTIAGSDPSGGAGMQADLKTFHQFGVYGMAAVTLLTVQNTQRVSRVEILSPELITGQIAAVLEDIPPHAVKTGALGNSAVIEAVAQFHFPCPLVVDPVMISKHGAPLIGTEARSALITHLLPKTALLTPNLHEAEVLAGIEVTNLPQMQEAALRIADLGAASVLIKGGHLEGDALDLLYHQGGFHCFTAPRHNTAHTHGTGCTYSAAITALLASGEQLTDAISVAKAFISNAIESNPGLGHGHGPVNHWANPV